MSGPPACVPDGHRVVSVTALVDIGRGAHDGRGADTYVQWLLATAAFHVHMTIFLHDALAACADAVRAARPEGYDTELVLIAAEDVPLWRDVPRVRAILAAAATDRAAERRTWISDAALQDACLEYVNPAYAALIASKPAFVERAIALDAASARGVADAYLWLDAGIAHYVPLGARPVLGPVRASAVDECVARAAVLVTGRAHIDSYRGYTPAAAAGITGGSILAGVLLGPPAAWRAFRAASDAAWDEMLAAGRVCNEQVLWSTLAANGRAPTLRPVQTAQPNAVVRGVGRVWVPLLYHVLHYPEEQGGADATVHADGTGGDKEGRGRSMRAIATRYAALAAERSDINEHLPTLRRYAAECDSVAEMGVRAVVSTWALIHGLATSPRAAARRNGARLHCVDLDAVDTSTAAAAAAAVGVTLTFTQADSASPAALTAPVDMLFIDTLHVYAHLKRELAAHHALVARYIAMHDTEVDGYDGEARRNACVDPEHWSPSVLAAKTGYGIDEVSRGLKPAITEFLAAHGDEWELHERFANNNGLTVLKRIGGAGRTLIPLGFDCRVATALRRHGVRGEAFPLDWVTSPSTDGLCAALRARGRGVVDAARLQGEWSGGVFTARHRDFKFQLMHEWTDEGTDVVRGESGYWLANAAQHAVVAARHARRWACLGVALAAGGARVIRPSLRREHVPSVVAALHAAADGGRARGVTLHTFRWSIYSHEEHADLDHELASWPRGGDAWECDGVLVRAHADEWESDASMRAVMHA